MEHHTVGHAVEGGHHHLWRHGGFDGYLLELIAVGKGIGAHKADSRPQLDTTQPFVVGEGIGADDLPLVFTVRFLAFITPPPVVMMPPEPSPVVVILVSSTMTVVPSP